MSPSSLAELFENNPHQPYRLTLASGDQIIVDNPGRVLIFDLQAYVGQSSDPLARVASNLKIVSIPNINLVEPINLSDPRLRRRRRK